MRQWKQILEKDGEGKDRKGRVAAADSYGPVLFCCGRKGKKEEGDNGCGLSRRLRSLEA